MSLHSEDNYIKKGNCVYDEDGNKLQEDLRLDDGSGFCKTWYKTGKLRMEVNFLNNEMHGYFKIFYEDGSPCIEEVYEYGKMKGTSKKWDKGGFLLGSIPIREAFAPKRKNRRRR